MKALAFACPVLLAAALFNLDPVPGPTAATSPITVPAAGWQCHGTFEGGTVLGECDCTTQQGSVSCTSSITIVPTGGTYACSDCAWSWSWQTYCPPCVGTATRSGTLDLHCDPHQLSHDHVIIPCPTSSQDWLDYTFDCPYCG